MNVYLNKNNKTQCCGCGVCAFACPTKAITMAFDSEGFAFPVVDNQLCINCGKCSRVCPMEVSKKHSEDAAAYAAHTRDTGTIMASSSGGMFTELAKQVLADGGCVCGCTIDDAHQVKHIVIDRTEDIPLLQGSKYVQSDLLGGLASLSDALKQGKQVLFVGTPCQVSAVKNQFDCENLLTIDLLCHGVPSQKLFDHYIQYLERKHHGKLIEIVFRDKEKFGWSITQRYKIQKGSRVKTYYLERHTSEYFSGFLRNMTQRESCYACPYTTLNRVGDITLADFWGVDKVRPELLNLQGTSLILANSHKGEVLLQAIRESVVISPVNLADATYQNGNFLAPPKRDPLRDSIYETIYNDGFKNAGKKYLLPKNSYKYKIAQALNINMMRRSLTRRKKH